MSPLTTAPNPIPAPPRPRVAARPLPGRAAPLLLTSDIVVVIAATGVCIVGLWVRHGGLAALGQGWVPGWTAVTQLSGLLASAVGLLGLLLVARPASLERVVGLDRMFLWHRYTGEATAVLVGSHVAAALVVGSATGGLWSAVRDLTGRQPYMAAATVGALLIGVVTVTSLRTLRRLIGYETWYFVHLLAYLGLALAFAHELVLGGDLAADRLARWFWVALHITVIAVLVWSRWGPTLRAAIRPLRVTAIVPHGPTTAALHLSGGGLAGLTAEPGQFFLLRALRPGLWWQTHPYSLSAPPTTAGLRFSVKERGDASHALTRLPLGARVAVEGPYGTCTPAVAEGRKVVFVVGGVGVAPARAILEHLDRSHQPVVLCRARTEADLTHLDELQRLAPARAGRVLTLLGPTAALAAHDPFGAASLRAAVPDIA
ncbi:MAG TPA: ferric reductase-like transmembrane domain-containing protein, partial [Acidimicrobiales bacterium]